MIPRELYEQIWKAGYEQAQANTPLIGTATEPSKAERRRDWRNFKETYPSGTWNTRVIEFVGDPEQSREVIGVTTPDGIPHAKTAKEWKPAGILARDCGSLLETIAEPSRVSLLVDSHEPEPMELRAELETVGTTPNELHSALATAPGVQKARVYDE